MRGFGLGRDADATGPEAREARDGVEARVGHPNGVVLLDGGADGGGQPGLGISFGHEVVGEKAAVDLASEIGKEGRLGAHEVVRSVAVEDLAVVLCAR